MDVESIPLESLIIVILVILILLVVLVIFIPAYLEAMSRRNHARREAQAARHQALLREARRVERLLIPYTRTRSAVYHDLAERQGELLERLLAEVADVERALAVLHSPEIFDYLLPVQHFVIAPEHVPAIISDARRLGRVEVELNEAEAVRDELQAGLDALAQLPERLRAERANLTARLAELEAAAAREREDGIAALDDFSRDAGALRGLLDDWDSAARPNASLMDLDRGALALQSAAAVLAEAEARLSELVRDKKALDRRLRRAAGELDNLQATNKASPAAAGLPQLRPLLRRAAALLNESAAGHRQRREFNAAGADVISATQLITFARDLATADQQTRTLQARDESGKLGEAIATLRQALDGLLERLPRDGGDGPGALTEATLADRAAKLRARAETLTRQQDAYIAALARQAAAAREELTREWEQGQALLRLADDEPLTRRYNRLLEQFEDTGQSPAALEQFRQDASAYAAVWARWVERVRASGTRIGRIQSGLSETIDQALAAAAPWNCLNEDLVTIQQRAADFETARAQFATVRYRREAEAIMDQLEAIESEMNGRFTQLIERAQRLAYLERDVEQIAALSANTGEELPPDHPDQAKRERTLQIIDHHLRAGHAAVHYEDASLALLRAADAANKLAL